MKQELIVAGKRKTAIARARIREGTGNVRIDHQPYIFLPFIRRMMIEEPLALAREHLETLNFDLDVDLKGGGPESRIEAARLAIAKAIVAFSKSEKLKKAYLAYDRNLLVADVRRKETYKPGDSKARAKRQKSYR